MQTFLGKYASNVDAQINSLTIYVW